MAGPDNVAFHELCRLASHHLVEAMDYLWATPDPESPAPSPAETEAIQQARRSVAEAQVALRFIKNGADRG